MYAALKIYNQKEEYKKAETEYEQLQKKEKNIDFGELKKLNINNTLYIHFFIPDSFLFQLSSHRKAIFPYAFCNTHTLLSNITGKIRIL